MCFAGILAGAIAACLYLRSTRVVLTDRLAAQSRQIEQAAADLGAARNRIGELLPENTTLKIKVAELDTTLGQERKAAAEKLLHAQRTAVVVDCPDARPPRPVFQIA